MKKKVLVIVNLFLFVLVLSGCDILGQGTVAENEAPVVTGSAYIALSLNDEIPDWKLYITAEDEEDGAIRITDDMVEADTVDLTIEGIYQVRFYVNDSDGKTTLHTMDVEVIDNRTFTFELIGSSEIDIEVNTSFVDPGVTALDLDGVISAFSTEGSVDMSTPGIYNLTYSMEGYELTLSRTVNVEDSIAPTIVVADVYVLFGATNDIDWLSYVDEIYDNYSADTDIDVEITEDTVDFDTIGTYSVTIKAIDEAGNEATLSFNVMVQEMVLLVIGDSEIDVEVNTEYEDEGAVVIDSSLNSYTVIGTDNLDMSVVGDYTIEYTVEGYPSLVATRIIHVVDSTPPVVDISTMDIMLNSTPVDWTTYSFDVSDNYSDVVDVEVLSDNIDYAVLGSYQVTLLFSDEISNSIEITFIVNVSRTFATGIYDLSDLPGEEKAILFAALEDYLLENVYAGVPLYRSASFTMFSDRTELFSPEYNGVLGYGAEFSQFTEDDSTVLMYGDVYGQTGEYTWRTSFNYDPNTLNHWVADDGYTSDFIDKYTGSLYDFYFDSTKEGFEINSSLASGEPIPVNPEIIDGKVYATIWQIPVRDDLTWTFHPDTDVSGYAPGYETLDASDYLWTWENALSNTWFRAISGGGDFITHGVKNASEFINGSVAFSEVGLRMAEGETNVLELEFLDDKSAYEIKYMFNNSNLAPINQELFEDVGEAGYGLSPETVASSGVYYFDTWTSEQLLTFKKNNEHPDSAMYHYTAYQYRYIDGSDAIFAEFEAGRLDSAVVPSTRVEEFVSDPLVHLQPNATTWRLMINAFGTESARDAYIEQYPNMGIDEEWVPEPILMYTEMRQALYYGFDRYEAAVNVVKTYLPAYTLFAPTYFIDAESGISVRGTAAGQEILTKYGEETYGYFPDNAVDLFKDAVAQSIVDGYYTAGTEIAPTLIELQLYCASSGNTAMQTLFAELEQQYENLLYDDVNHIGIDIIINDVDFPGNYYEHMMIASMDLGLGGISGSLLDAPSFLDIFNDNNSGGFTFNWGIDTHTANIIVSYTNLEGNMTSEIWSYNALVSALNKKTYVKDGLIQETWDDEVSLIEAYTDMQGLNVDSISEGSAIAPFLIGDTLEQIAAGEGFDELIAKVVTTESTVDLLYIISVVDGDYRLYNQYRLYESAGEAILNHSGYENDLYFVNLTLLDDAGVAANPYLISQGVGFTSIAEIAATVGSPPANTQVYAIDWGGMGEWSDAYVVIHIGNYYIGFAWL